MDGHISESVSTVRSIPSHTLQELQEANSSEANAASGNSISLASSPRSSGLPSPPDSPTDSVSSLPSVTSSFFFSSAAASPGHFARPLDHHEHDQDSRSEGSHESTARNATRGLIIPSLTLPPALRRPTPYGKTLGEVRLLVLGRQGAGKSFLTGLLLEDNEEVIDVGTWEDPIGEDDDHEDEMFLLGKAGAKVLHASTDWVEHTDAHGLEKFEPAKNVEIVELPGYDALTDGNTLVTNLRNVIRAPFHTIADMLHPNSQPCTILTHLLSSPATPLFTALVLLLPSAPTLLDRLVIDSLGGDIPIIVLSTPHTTVSSASSSNSNLPPATVFLSSFTRASRSKLSAFHPYDAVALKKGLFHSPETISALRVEATERFLRWREVERAVADVLHHRSADTGYRGRGRTPNKPGWDKEKWERDWMEHFSRDVYVEVQQRRTIDGTDARQLYQQPPPPYHDDEEGSAHEVSASDSISSSPFSSDPEKISLSSCHSAVIPHTQSFDPLHLPSLLLFTVSMLGPLKTRIVEAIKAGALRLVSSSPPPPSSTLSDPAGDLQAHRSARKSRGADRMTESQTLRWIALGGMLSAGFCVGVGVGATWSSSK